MQFQEDHTLGWQGQEGGSLGHVIGTLPEEATLYRKRFREGVSPNMSEGMVTTTTFNATRQTS